jgi:predicted RNase H-like HicB family nuclease
MSFAIPKKRAGVGEHIMSKTVKPRVQARRSRSAPRPVPATASQPVTLDVTVRLQVIALPEADGGFTVVIPALGCATEGETMQEAQANAVEAAEGWLASQHKRTKDGAVRATKEPITAAASAAAAHSQSPKPS